MMTQQDFVLQTPETNAEPRWCARRFRFASGGGRDYWISGRLPDPGARCRKGCSPSRRHRLAFGQAILDHIAQHLAFASSWSWRTASR